MQHACLRTVEAVEHDRQSLVRLGFSFIFYFTFYWSRERCTARL